MKALICCYRKSYRSTNKSGWWGRLQKNRNNNNSGNTRRT